MDTQALALTLDQAEKWLRRCLARPNAGVLLGDRLEDTVSKALVPAAVLMPIVVRPDELTVLLTQRTENLSKHAGQISFPGGRYEEIDVNLEATALRETQEEIGLDPERITLVGRLPEYITITGYQVTPVVGLVSPPFDLRIDDNEVAEAFEVPLSLFLHQHNFERHPYNIDGRTGTFLALNYHHRFIWGATAGMLMSFCECMNATPLTD